MALTIQTSEKVKQYARICLWGVEKSGKTHQALLFATALAGEDGKVGVISSEYGSSKLLARKFPHDIIDLGAPDEYGKLPKDPFAPARYEEAIHLFIKAGYKAIIIDSLSHSWAGEGGMLEAVGKIGGQSGKNTYTDGWGANTPIYNRLINTILAAKCHMIVTLRAKEKYEMEEYTKSNGKSGTRPVNVGEAPVMRKGFNYEMQLTIRMDAMTAYIQSSAVEEYIHRGEEIEKPRPELAYRLLDALDGVELPEPTQQEQEVRRLLEEFREMYPGWCAKTPKWEPEILKKALEMVPNPSEYTDDDVLRLTYFVAGKKQEKQQKVS